MKRLLALSAPLATLLLSAQAAMARGGGGSSHFGGGGGGFGGGGGGFGRGGGAFGRGHFFFIPIGGGGGILVLIIIAIIIFWILPKLIMWWRGQQTAGRSSVSRRVAGRQRIAERERKVELAAAEASEDDSAFDPDTVRKAGGELFKQVQNAWDQGDRAALRKLVGPELYEEWERRLNDFDRKGWRNRVEVASVPSVDYVGLRNAQDDSDDRVTVLIQARLRDYVIDRHGRRLGRTDQLGDTSMVREYWTLGKQPDDAGAAQEGEAGRRAGGKPANRWIVLSIEQGAEGEHAL
jgi:predicted lipid-binding transport protein (Tim44 family)